MHKSKHNKSKISESKNLRIITILLLVILIMAVRLYYYSGPIFANSQDEGIYLTTYASTLIFKNPVSFAPYKNVDFSNFNACMCNPAQEFQFYVGFIYPEMLVLWLFGFSAALAIYYIIFTSMVEGLFIFLIIERISKFRAAVIGTIIFAFLPVDVLFSTHVQPLVPAMMLITISIYMFILATEGKRKYLLYSLTGFFSGLAYITNPIGAATLIFLLLICILRFIKNKPERRNEFKYILFILLGFVIAYSLIGIVYLIEAGKYFLYVLMGRAVYSFQDATQPISTVCPLKSVCLNYVNGYPAFYISILANVSVLVNSYLRYFGILLYAFIAMALVSIIPKKRNQWAALFIFMFLFYLIFITFFPTKIASSNGVLYIYPISEVAYITTIFTLPLVVVSALGIEELLKRNKVILIIIVLAILATVVICDVIILNRDVIYYRASMSTVHAFVNYVEQHANATFYANYLFSGEANLLTGYKYHISSLQNCSAKGLQSLTNNTYIATGGTISLDIDPQFMQNFDTCVVQNATGYEPVYTANNPLLNYTNAAPPLEIYKK